MLAPPNPPRLADEPVVGDQLGPYLLDAVAGEGSMGRVFRATHTRLGRTVALKVLRRRYAERPEEVARFVREARAVNRIRHAGTAEITDFVAGESGAPSYYVMEWLEGETLAQRLARVGALPAHEVAAIGRQLAEALAAAHRAGFVHRDITPGNIFLTRHEEASVRLLDFGIVQTSGEHEEGLRGTPAYFSPETAAGRATDARADIYSLGVVLYEAVAGRRPFERGTLPEWAMAHMTASPLPLPDGVPRWLARVIRRCLEKAPVARFPSMTALAAALRQEPGEVSGRVVALVLMALLIVGSGLGIALRQHAAAVEAAATSAAVPSLTAARPADAPAARRAEPPAPAAAIPTSPAVVEPARSPRPPRPAPARPPANAPRRGAPPDPSRDTTIDPFQPSR